MNLQSIFGGLFTTLTGVDTTSLTSQLDTVEQATQIAVEVIIFLLVVITLELFVVIRNTAK